MPGHYGEVQGMLNVGGDPVDVTLGRWAHRADLPVFVVDQVRLLGGEFDEYKCFLGWHDQAAALAAYDGSFSDGSSPKRRKAVSRLSLPDFRIWVRGSIEGLLAKSEGSGDRPGEVTKRLAVVFRV